ncbi:aminoacyl-tRNA hydrolase [Thermorudis peleae]|uniref:aminoacyl-tRNA hydrolase n=1 Tax=Thermorudis peleae TaxID=1382356 RepID=UPI0005712888|nr:aminoacyl-tRNA hydrolase [Thermorudis peleae]MBX6753434.1 aminoacyl-tRNA hydrolase [Thermorudis peleae]
MPDTPTWAIVGLGNPGPEYAATRHNIGFQVVDALATLYQAPLWDIRFEAAITSVTDQDGGRIVLAKPLTYMNASGRAVQQLLRWYRLPLERLLVIHDDLDLPFGTLRLRHNGSSGGHHGVESIIQAVGAGFDRLRIGIGRPPRHDATRYVLEAFTADERAVLPSIIEQAAAAAQCWRREGLTAAMNRFNRAVVATQGRH